MSNPKIGSSAYKAGFQKGDKLLNIGAIALDGSVEINSILNTYKANEEVKVMVQRFGSEKEIILTISTDVSYGLKLLEGSSKEVTKKIKQKRASWLNSKV